MTRTTAGTARAGDLVVEWAPFRLRAGVDEAEFLRASDEFQETFVRRQRGFVRRELLKGTDGQWVDLVVWADQAAADAVMPAAMEEPACHMYFQYMPPFDRNDPGAGVLRF